MSSPLKWGILSTGRIADWFCSDFFKVEDGALHAVGSRNQATADEFAKRFQIPNAYGSYKALIADPEIDVIYIGTPHVHHFDNASAALAAGKAVLCEKPLTVGASDTARLTNIAQESNAYLMEAMWTYFLPAIKQAKQWVDDGRIGQLRHIKTDFGYPVSYGSSVREYDAELGGGCLLEMGIYPIAIAYLFSGQDPIDILPTGFRAANGVEDDVTAIFTYDGLTGAVGTSFRCRLRNAAHIVGTDGYIVIPDAFRADRCSLYVLDEKIDEFEAVRETRGYEYQAIQVCKDIREGKTQSDIVPHITSLAFQSHIERIKAGLPR